MNITSGAINAISKLNRADKATTLATHYVVSNVDRLILRDSANVESIEAAWTSRHKFKLLKKLRKIDELITIPINMILEQAENQFKELHECNSCWFYIYDFDDATFSLIMKMAYKLGDNENPTDIYDNEQLFYVVTTQMRDEDKKFDVSELLEKYRAICFNRRAILNAGVIPKQTVGAIVSHGFWNKQNNNQNMDGVNAEALTKLINEVFKWEY